MIAWSTRATLLTASAALCLAASGCGGAPDATSTPSGYASSGPESADESPTPTPTASPSATAPTTDIEVDMAPARVVAIALATGNFSDVDIDQYLTGEAVNRADEIIASGADANASSIARFGTVHHATTLNSFEKAEYSRENGRTMLTVITFGWDAPPDSSDLPEFTGASMVPGSPGTLAWYMTIDDTGLIDGIWTESEVGDYD
ncbi:hypothetical protein QU670_07770 [Actinomyces massiliensis]|uniref:Lipoprotein n=1 Tax=Actinomyces massiliensis F0489 TaxID=1125718 RepID=J1HLQ4_9ACTO|nr:hypothetical protein [Actinomyces massiliensis]EJF46498.1 hypothetical protein HMPREF1318_1695 [Actinomyces massiliensis F0489]WLD70408.1 hypothetical protein QU670_07770 [Actinomyces massiliensis]